MKTYHIGLSMAGAVSAGAYTAGVLTQLFETINSWYTARETGITFTTPDGKQITLTPDRMPKHAISIEALSGASAGAMCTALLAVCIAEGGFDRLHSTWVKEVDLRPMLSVSDLKNTEDPIHSLFNVDVINKIAENIKKFTTDPALNWPPYLAEVIDMYLTLTNLEGVPYDLSFNSSSSTNQVIRNFADYKRFTLHRAGTAPEIPGDSTALDPSMKNSTGKVAEWSDLVDACVASGAFPGGLKPRTLSRRKSEYDQREWFVNYQIRDGVTPSAQFIPVSWAPGTPDPIKFQYVDGGVMNNEPFELVRRRLAINRGLWRNKTRGSEAQSGVIMIDPFPSNAPEISGTVVKKLPEVHSLLMILFGSMRNQSLFSPDLLYAALDPSVYSRFLVAPSRYEKKGTGYEAAPEPLASSILGAFGGFISESFRQHDYELGRRNCYDFLRKHFSLPLSNDIVSYVEEEGLTDDYLKAGWITADRTDGMDSELHMQIVPVMPPSSTAPSGSPLLPEPGYPAWPKVDSGYLDELRDLAYQRFERMLDCYIDQVTSTMAAEKTVNAIVDKTFLNKKWFRKKWDALIGEPLSKLGLTE